ncbi:MAG: hypothetical protein J6W31_02690, partial [Clostridia bacterium]|nr:hypothetical protein [Clostridia bacterium]
KFSAEAPVYTIEKTEFVCKGASVSDDINATSEKAFRAELAVSPSHGDLRLNGDGSFTYYAEEGFTGADRFALKLNFGYAVTQEIVITVTVE